MEQYKLHKYLLKYGLCSLTQTDKLAIYNNKINYYKDLCIKNGIMVGGKLDENDRIEFKKSVEALTTASLQYAEAHTKKSKDLETKKTNAVKALEDLAKHIPKIDSMEDITFVAGQGTAIFSDILKVGIEITKPILLEELEKLNEKLKNIHIPPTEPQIYAAKKLFTTSLGVMLEMFKK